MKVETKSKVEFQPVDVTFTLESQEELDVVAALFNVSSLFHLLRQVCPSVAESEVWYHLKEVGADLTSEKHEQISQTLANWKAAYDKAPVVKHQVSLPTTDGKPPRVRNPKWEGDNRTV